MSRLAWYTPPHHTTPPTPRAPTPASDATRRWRLRLAVIGILAAGVLAYLPALRAPFIFDDVDSVIQNHTIDRVFPLSGPLAPPAMTPVAGRPFVNLTFALNRALNRALIDAGPDSASTVRATDATLGFHLGNLALHLATALLILALLRITVRTIVTPTAAAPDEPRIAEWLIVLVVGIWTLHPLETAAVDYITQRTEVLVSLCYVATLYASVRAWDAATRRSSLWWSVGAVVACFLGMESKEVMITAPLAVVLYDLAFRREAVRRDPSAAGGSRRRFVLYAALFATSIPVLVSVARGARSDAVGFQLGVNWYSYLYSQGWAVTRYLSLALWPARLTFDYGQRPVGGWVALPGTAVAAALLASSIYSWARWPRIGFVGLWFFLLLAPSSSVVPIRTESADERRIYLALLPVAVVLVFGANWLWRWAIWYRGAQRTRFLSIASVAIGIVFAFASHWTAWRMSSDWAWLIQIGFGLAAVGAAWLAVMWTHRRWALGALLLTLAVLTALRSARYATPEQLWRDTIAKAPGNARAYDQLGAQLLRQDSTRTADARELFATAILTDSMYPYGWTNLADVEVRLGRAAQAQALLEHVLRIYPRDIDATRRLGGVLLLRGQSAQAIPLLARVAQAQPTVGTLGDLAAAYDQAGRGDDAARTLEQLAALEPDRSDVQEALAAALIKNGRADSAVAHLRMALARDSSTALLTLMATAQAELRQADSVVAAAAAVVKRTNVDAATLAQLADALEQAGRASDAVDYLNRALALAPEDLDLRTRLAIAEAAAGHVADGRALLRGIIDAHPDFLPARSALAHLGAR